MASATDEYKALTVVNLPFIGEDGAGKRFRAGQMIPLSDFEAYADKAMELVDNPEGNVPSAQEVIEHMLEWGSISEDPEAELHPDHLPVDPGKPTLARLIEQAQEVLQDLESRGQDVPESLRKLAAVQHRAVVGNDSGEGTS